jgi:hypothetical protein
MNSNNIPLKLMMTFSNLNLHMINDIYSILYVLYWELSCGNTIAMLSIVLSRHGLSPSRARFKHIQLQLIFPNWSLHSIASRTIYVCISSLLHSLLYSSTCYAWHQHLLKLKNSLRKSAYKIKIPSWFLRSTPRFCKPHNQSLLLFTKNSMAWLILHVVWLMFILQICPGDSFVLNNQILVGLGVIGCIEHF